MTIALADVSEFQNVINWSAYGAANPAVIARIHNSARADNYARANIAGARAHCQWRGWYQYLTAGADPVKAAHDMQATLGPTLPGEVMILDLEAGTGDQRARRQAWLTALQDPVEWTYSGLSFARAHLPGVKVEWLAAYGQGEPADSHLLWQNTDARRFAGISSPCDGSLFNGTLAQLQTLTHASTSGVDMPLTADDVSAVVTGVLSATLGRSGQNVGQALQNAGSVSNGPTLAAIVAGVIAATPKPTTGAVVDQTALAAAVVASLVGPIKDAVTAAVATGGSPTAIADAVVAKFVANLAA